MNGEKKADKCEENDHVESSKHATLCVMSMRDDVVHVEWNTRSKFDIHLPDDLQQFLVQEYNLDTVQGKTLTIYTQYKRNGVFV